MQQVYKKRNSCDGKGRIQVMDFEHYTTSGIGTNTQQCPKCEGFGFIETEFFIEENPFELKRTTIKYSYA